MPAVPPADEPTGDPDARSADEVFAQPRRFDMAQRTTILFVTHDAGLVARRDKIDELIDERLKD